MNLPTIKHDPLFDYFWSAYPAGHKGGKIAAQKAWVKLAPNDDDLQTILTAIERQKKERHWREGFAIPHASTYLNQARFMDEPVPELKLVEKTVPWYSSNERIEAKGKELGIFARGAESWHELRARISAAIGA